MEAYIELENISKQFHDKKVLTDINIKVDKGEIFGLLGPSGAGKTTMIKILTGQIKQNSGEAKLLGCDTKKLTQETYAKIGMVLDEFGLYERLTCYQNLKIFSEIFGIKGKNIEEVLDKVGLLEAKKIAVSKLSKGMKQRLVLARAIITNPKVMFLDEPTSSLDPSTTATIHNLILKQKELGTAVFLTTHKMEEAAKLCDHIGLLYEGKIVEYGNPEEICRRYNSQKRIHIRLTSGEEVDLESNGSSAEQIYQYLMNNEIDTIHSSEPNLESVFMQLTGKELSI